MIEDWTVCLVEEVNQATKAIKVSAIQDHKEKKVKKERQMDPSLPETIHMLVRKENEEMLVSPEKRATQVRQD